MIFGFDISTTNIGICILNDDGSFVSLSHLSFYKDLSFWDRIAIFEREIISYRDNVITKVFIEEPKKSFTFGRTSIDTILQLAKFNAICSYIIYKKWKIMPIHLNESSARKTCGLKVVLPSKLDGKSQKQQVFEQLSETDLFKDYKWEFKKTGKIKDYHLDEMDAYVVARAGFLSNGK